MSIRICRICEQFPPASGGLAPGMLHLSLAQHRQGHRVTVITKAADGDSAYDTDLPFPVVRIPCVKSPQFGWKAFDAYRRLPDRPDIVHTHGPAAFYYLLRRRSADAPLVHSMHAVRKYQYSQFSNLPAMVNEVVKRYGIKDFQKPSYFPFYSPNLMKELFLERQICRNADRLIVVAQYFVGQISDYYKVSSDKIDVSYNGSNFGCDPGPGISSNYPEDTGLKKEHKIILYVGRTDWVKRVHLLVEALPLVKKRVDNPKLVIAGTGDQFEVLAALAKKLKVEEDVKLLGWVPHDRLAALYHRASCFCLPSYWEGLSKSLLEAMSIDIPVIATSNMANREVLKDGKLGWLVDVPVPLYWSNAIVAACNNGHAVQRKTAESSSLLDKKYRWHHVAARVHETYKKVVK